MARRHVPYGAIALILIIGTTNAFAQGRMLLPQGRILSPPIISCPLATPGPGFKVSDGTYVLSKQSFSAIDTGLLGTIKSMFGFNVWLADWHTLTTLLRSRADAESFIKAVGIPLQTDGRCDNFIVAGAMVGDPISWIARHDGGRNPRPGIIIQLSSVADHMLDLTDANDQSSGQAILFVHAPQPLNAQDQVMLFSKYNDLLLQSQSTSKDSNQTMYQRDTNMRELQDQIKRMTLSADTVVHDWTCNVTEVAETYYFYFKEVIGDVMCKYDGLGLHLILKQNDPVLRQISREASINFDGHVIEDGHTLFTNDVFPAIFVAHKITIN